MFAYFLEMLSDRLDVLAIVSIAVYLLTALALLLFHLAYSKPASPGGKALAAVAVLAAMLWLSSCSGGLMSDIGVVAAMVLARWVRPGRRIRILAFAALPVTVVVGVWLYGTWDDASIRYARRRHLAAEEAREKAETGESQE